MRLVAANRGEVRQPATHPKNCGSGDPELRALEELLISLLEGYWPRNFLGERLIKYLADEEWEVARYKRHKIFLIERRFQASLAFQADREKATREDKAVLAKRLDAQPPCPSTLPEEALKGSLPRSTLFCCAPRRNSTMPARWKSALSISSTSTGCSMLPLRAAMPFSPTSRAAIICLIRPSAFPYPARRRRALRCSSRCTRPANGAGSEMQGGRDWRKQVPRTVEKRGTASNLSCQ